MTGLDDAKILFIQELKGQIIEIESNLYGNHVTKESIVAVGKIVHKVKGAAGFFHFSDLEIATKALLNRCKKVEDLQFNIDDEAWKKSLLKEYQIFKSAVLALIDV
jgi:chemotaxis protein histidine kinase CheA